MATPHGLTAIIDLPLKAPDQDMVAYEIVSRPVLEQGTKRPVKAKSEGDFLLVNEDAYVLLSRTDWTRCRTGKFTVCPAANPVYHWTTKSCVMAMFLADQVGIRSTCEWEIGLAQSNDTWIWDDYQEVWHFNVWSSERVQILCRRVGSSQTKEEVISGSGSLRIPEGCTLWTPNYRLLPMAEDYQTGTEADWKWLEVNPVEPICLLDNITMDDGIVEKVVQELADMHKIEEHSRDGGWTAWTAINSHLYRRREEQEFEERWHLALLVSTGLILLTATIGIAIGWILKRRHANSEDFDESTSTRPRQRGVQPDMEVTVSTGPSFVLPTILYPQEGLPPGGGVNLSAVPSESDTLEKGE